MSGQAIRKKTVNRNAKRQKRHPKSSKNKMFIFGLCSTCDDGPSWSMDSKPICSPLQPIKCNGHFWITFNFCWLAGLVDGLEPHLPPVSSQKDEMLIFGLRSTSDDQPGWSMDLNPSTTPLQPKQWNAHFWITFNFLWSARLVEGLEPCLPCLSNQKNEMLIFGLCSTPDDWLGWSWTRTPSATPLQPKRWNAHFWIMFNSWWLAGLVDGLEPCPPPLSNQKNEMLIFGSCSTSDDLLGWSMDSNPICHPSSAKKMKCSFLDYVQLLMISRLIQAKNINWNTKKTQKGPLSHQKIKCLFLDYIQLLMIEQAIWEKNVNWNVKKRKRPRKSSKNKMFIFRLCSTSDDRMNDLSKKHWPKCKKNPKKAP